MIKWHPCKRFPKSIRSFRSYDLTSATDRFPLKFQDLVIEQIFGQAIARTWVKHGLGINSFLAPRPNSKRSGLVNVQFATGQPMGSYSSWPLFSLCHHLNVWLAAEKIYPGKRFLEYALLGDDIVIADARVAQQY